MSLVAVLAMVGATAFWGASGGAVAGVHVNGFTSAAVVELTTGIVLTAFSVTRGSSPRHVLRGLGRRLPMLAGIEAANVVLYYVALQHAPVGPVMAMHLTAPVMLAVIAVARGDRRLSRRGLFSLVAILAALLLIALGNDSGSSQQGLAIGLILSLASAACIALFVTLVRNVANDVEPLAAAGVQMLCSGIILTPALIGLRGHGDDVLPLVVIAVSLFAPACYLYWKGMRNLTPISAGSIQLAEPFFGATTALVLYGDGPSIVDVAAVTMVIAATYAELVVPARSVSLETESAVPGRSVDSGINS
jgi:drug/metabolite transporter, DME family